MSYEFRVVPHSAIPGEQMVECWRDGRFVAGIYPHQEGIRIISKYLADVSRETGPDIDRGEWIPAAIIELRD